MTAAGVVASSVAEVLVPPVLGLGLAAALRRAGLRVVVARVVPAVLSIVGALVAVALGVSLGAQDVLWLGFGVAPGALVLPEKRPDPRALGLAAAIVVVSLAVLETASGLVTLPALQVPALEELRLTFDVMRDDATCPALFADLPADTGPRGMEARLARAEGRPHVVWWVGDSMVEGVDPAVTTFPDLLNARSADVAHVNLGFRGTGPDFQALLLRRWLAVKKPERLMLTVFGNDLDDVFRVYPCCAAGPLLRATTGDDGRATFEPRCDRAEPSPALSDRIRFAPPPLFLRAAAGSSSLARAVIAALARAGNETPSWLAGDDRRWSRYRDVLAYLVSIAQQAGVPLTALVLPDRAALVDRDRAAHGKRQANLLNTLEIPMLDASEALLAEERTRTPTTSLFNPAPDTHLSAAGHAWLADWLAAHPD